MEKSNLDKPEHMKVGPLLRQLDRGQLWSDMEKGLAEMCDGLELHGGKAEMALKVTARMQNGVFVFDSSLKVVSPEAARVPTMAFRDGAGELTQNDPRQPKFEAVNLADARNGVRADSMAEAG